jgi:hypothetical protein
LSELSLIRGRKRELNTNFGVRLSSIASYPEVEHLSHNDLTDSALEAVASILGHPEPAEGPAQIAVEQSPDAPWCSVADGYQKIGPGPIVAIRLKWKVRREPNGEYYVDETIADSMPVVTGPMSGDAAINFVDECESQAQRRFEAIRSEMTGRAAAANFLWNDGGEM